MARRWVFGLSWTDAVSECLASHTEMSGRLGEKGFHHDHKDPHHHHHQHDQGNLAEI